MMHSLVLCEPYFNDIIFVEIATVMVLSHTVTNYKTVWTLITCALPSYYVDTCLTPTLLVSTAWLLLTSNLITVLRMAAAYLQLYYCPSHSCCLPPTYYWSSHDCCFLTPTLLLFFAWLLTTSYLSTVIAWLLLISNFITSISSF